MTEHSVSLATREEMQRDQAIEGIPPTAGDDIEIWIRPPAGWALPDLHELWTHRELLYFLVWRDLKIRYKQTVLGPAWIILQPLGVALIYAVFLGLLIGVPSGGVPYPLFLYSSLLPWMYFSQAINNANNSLVSNSTLLTKIYFPRLIIPIVPLLSGLVDFAMSFVIWIGMMLFYGFTLRLTTLLLPVFMVTAAALALGVGLWMAALNILYRDVGYLLSIALQAWMYATPVLYSTTLLPERWRPIYQLNPMVGVIEGIRWALLSEGYPPSIAYYILSAIVILLVLFSGAIYFRRVEQTFADVV